MLTKGVTIDSQMVSLKVWDMADKDKMQNIQPSLLSKADGVILLCDQSNAKSITNLPRWKRLVEDNCQKCGEVVPIFLGMNKADLTD